MMLQKRRILTFVLTAALVLSPFIVRAIGDGDVPPPPPPTPPPGTPIDGFLLLGFTIAIFYGVKCLLAKKQKTMGNP